MIFQSRSDVRPDHYTFNFLFRTCAQLLARGTGKGVHGGVIKRGFEFDSHVKSGLIFMYAELCCLDSCHKMLEVIPHPDLICQTAMVSACAKCGDVSFARKPFDLLPQRDGIAWSGKIARHAQCGHFESMRRDYGIVPHYDHYGCMVDLYGRAGRLNEALDIIKTMPMKPHIGAWPALLNSCTLYKNMELAELASRKIIELEGKHHGFYVLLSNIYADSKNWERADNVRQIMTAKGSRKQPCCSAIEVDSEVHEFFAGDNSHPRHGEIEVMLGEISRILQVSGNVINTSPSAD